MVQEISLSDLNQEICENESLVKWATKYINDLPDSAFAYITPGGKKDDEGKTIPRSLRHLPYKDKGGTIDPAHVRNALARLPQTDIPESAKAKARKVLIAAAKKVGIDVTEKNNLEETEMSDEKEIKEDGSVEDASTPEEPETKPETETPATKEETAKATATLDTSVLDSIDSRLSKIESFMESAEARNASLHELVSTLKAKLDEATSKPEAEETPETSSEEKADDKPEDAPKAEDVEDAEDAPEEVKEEVTDDAEETPADSDTPEEVAEPAEETQPEEPATPAEDPAKPAEEPASPEDALNNKIEQLAIEMEQKRNIPVYRNKKTVEGKFAEQLSEDDKIKRLLTHMKNTR